MLEKPAANSALFETGLLLRQIEGSATPIGQMDVLDQTPVLDIQLVTDYEDPEALAGR